MKVSFNSKGLPNMALGKKVLVESVPLGELQKSALTQRIETLEKVGNFTYVSWFEGNNFPHECDEEINQNATLTRSLQMLTEIAAGAGLVPVRVKSINPDFSENLEIVNDPELISLLDEGWIYFYLYEALRDRAKFGTAFAQLRPSLAGDKILKISVANALYTRVGEPKNGISQNVVYCGTFPAGDAKYAQSFPLLNPYDPFEHLVQLQADNKFSKTIFYQIRNRFSNNINYTKPNWYSAKSWAEVSTKIPKLIDASYDNVLNVTTLIRIPYQYFDKKYPLDEFDNNVEKRKEAIQADLDTLENEFTSVEKAKKTLITFFGGNESDANSDKWEFEIIQPTSNADSVKDATAADSYLAIAAGINPDCIGLMYGNSKGGSMQREIFLLQEITSTSARKEVLEPIEMMIKFNYGAKYEDVQLRFKQNFLTTLDTGKQTGTTLN